MIASRTSGRAAGVVLALALVFNAVPADAGGLFDSNVEKLLKLTPQQRSKVTRIVRASDAKMRVVFRKYGINPNGPVAFKKLVEAGPHLQRIGRRERQQMQKVLDAKQMAHYDRLIERTSARVRKAAR